MRRQSSMYSCPAAVRGSCTRPSRALHFCVCGGGGPVLRDVGRLRVFRCQNPTRGQSMRKIASLVFASVLLASAGASAATFVVTTHERLGPGLTAAGHPRRECGCRVADVIRFNILGSGPFVITVLTSPSRLHRQRPPRRDDPAGLRSTTLSSEREALSASISWPCPNSDRRSSRYSATVSPGTVWCSTAATTRRFAVCTSGASRGPTSSSSIRTTRRRGAEPDRRRPLPSAIPVQGCAPESICWWTVATIRR